MKLQENQKFRQDNTEGYTDKALEEMNAKLQKTMDVVSEDDPNFEEELKTASDKIFNEL